MIETTGPGDPEGWEVHKRLYEPAEIDDATTYRDQHAYFKDKERRLKNGETVWVRSNFDSSLGIVFTYGNQDGPLAVVDVDEYVMCDVYDQTGTIVAEQLSLLEAKAIAESLTSD